MKDFIELLEKYAQQFGLPEGLVSSIILILVALFFLFSFLNLFWKGIAALIRWRNEKLLNSDLHPFYSPADVFRATRYYIPTRYQNVAPSEDEEPGRLYIAAAKAKLVPLFLKEAFPRDKDNNKYYLILADTGMGKTTFMVNLYLAYKNQPRMPWGKPNYDIKLFPLGNPKTMEAVTALQDKKNTILLLDAFDEDIKAVHDYRQRMKEILEATWEFREVVVTCRTQFFPTQKEEPHETGYFTGGDSGEYKFQKLYLSVFSDSDVRGYLLKRFSIFNSKLWRAKAIAQKSPNLVVRPMLLSHIEDLVTRGREFKHTFEIYEALIERWIERESNKPGIREKHGSMENYRLKLFSFSQNLALDLYQNRDKRGGYFISKDEKIDDSTGLSLEEIEQDSLSETEKKSRSLLNRNAVGDYKFSHKSILEYFLAKQIINNGDLYLNFNFEGMDAAKRFFLEMYIVDLNKREGEFTLNAKTSPPKFLSLFFSKQYSLNMLTIEVIQYIEKLEVKELKGLNLMALKIFNNANFIALLDVSQFKLLYLLYVLYLYPKKSLTIEETYKIKEMQEMQILLEMMKLRGWGEDTGLPNLPEFKEVQRRLEYREYEELLKWQEMLRVDEGLEKRGIKTIDEFVHIKDYLKDIITLKSLLPNCSIYY